MISAANWLLAASAKACGHFVVLGDPGNFNRASTKIDQAGMKLCEEIRAQQQRRDIKWHSVRIAEQL
jgi:hypothetical protein